MADYVMQLVNVCVCIMLAAFLSADGKTKVNMFFRANDHIQLTKLKIKVLNTFTAYELNEYQYSLLHRNVFCGTAKQIFTV